jgi:hypothetical protein
MSKDSVFQCGERNETCLKKLQLDGRSFWGISILASEAGTHIFLKQIFFMECFS